MRFARLLLLLGKREDTPAPAFRPRMWLEHVVTEGQRKRGRGPG